MSEQETSCHWCDSGWPQIVVGDDVLHSLPEPGGMHPCLAPPRVGREKRRSIGGHQSAAMISDSWLTPPEIMNALGHFDLDPCCPPGMPWRTADVQYTKGDDGLSKPWFGRIYLNPPYSREAVIWLRKMVEHGNGVALTFARTETAWFFETVWRAATACLFIEGRIHFHLPDGRRADANAGAPSVLVAYGLENAACLKGCGIAGQYVQLTNQAEMLS